MMDAEERRPMGQKVGTDEVGESWHHRGTRPQQRGTETMWKRERERRKQEPELGTGTRRLTGRTPETNRREDRPDGTDQDR